MSASAQGRVALVIPALDEEEAIARVVQGFAKLRQRDDTPWVQEIVVADNGSRDRTAERARGAGATVVHAPERGYGHACLAGIAYLASRSVGPPDVVVFADGDGSNVPGELPDLLAPLEAGRAELVIGSRVHKADPGSLTVAQRFGNVLACYLIRALYRVEVTDLGPFRAIRWTTLVRLGMSDPTYGWTVEMQVKAARLGISIEEVSVSNRRRVAGRSKVSGTVRGVIGAGTKIIATILAHRG